MQESDIKQEIGKIHEGVKWHKSPSSNAWFEALRINYHALIQYDTPFWEICLQVRGMHPIHRFDHYLLP